MEYNGRKSTKSKSRMGRPPLGADARVVSLTVKVSANELALWRELAEKQGIGLRYFVLRPVREMTKGM